VVLARFHDDLGRRTYDIDRDTYRVLTGLEGELTFANIDWEIFYQYGESHEARTDQNNRHSRRFRLATDVTTDANGNPACRATVEAVQPTFDRDIDTCVPLNIFGVGLASQAAKDYVLVDLVNRAKLTQHVAGATLSGELFELPGGRMGFAGGAEFRRETSDFQPDSLFVQGAVFDGQLLPVMGKYEVLEGYLEVRAPILADLPGAKLLSIEGGVRISDYDSIGNTTSWRGALEWAPVADLRLRGGVARAVRAPNVGELFSPVRQSFAGILDPCDRLNVGLGPNPAQRLANCTAQLAPLGLNPTTFNDPQRGVTKRIIVGGNPELAEETADSTTIGLVFTPRFLKGFSAAIDAFDIEIEDAIEAPQFQQIVNDCYDRFESTANEFCGLFERVAGDALNGVIRNVRATQLNIAALETKGIDFTLRQIFDLGGRFGDVLNLSLVGTYLDEANFLPASNAADIDVVAGELLAPRVRGVLDVNYGNGPLTLGWRLRYIGEAVFDREEDPVEVRSPQEASAHPISDIQMRYRFGQQPRFDLYLGVNNVFDRDPPSIARAGATGAGFSP
ncbi:MAG: TonB-dependent receptor, partial [Steroidobacteraceae bacterium]